jgi:hypothetical protein
VKLYAVSHGRYSDYGIVAIYDDRALAEAYIAGKDDDYDIEEYELNPHADQIHEGLKVHCVIMDRAGTVLRHDESYGDLPDGENGVKPNHRWANGGSYKTYVFEFHTLAKSGEQAIKAANECRAQWIATGKEWPEDGPRPAPRQVVRFHNSDGTINFTGLSGSFLSTLAITIQESKE